MIEFGPDGPADGEPEEVLAAGPRRPPRGLGHLPSGIWAGLAVAVLVVAALVSAERSGDVPGHPVAAPASPRPSRPPATPPPVAPSVPISPSQASLNRVTTLANLVQPEFDTETALLPGARCAVAPKGVDPEQSVVTAVGSRLPEFRLVDSGAVLSPAGAMCGLLVRLRDASGAMVIVQVAVPPNPASAAFSLARSNDRTSVRDVAVISAGWRVEVGWVGQTGTDLGAAELTTLARDPRMRW